MVYKRMLQLLSSNIYLNELLNCCVTLSIYRKLEEDAHSFNARLRKRLEGFPDTVTCLAWSPDDTVLLTSVYNEIHYWETKVCTLSPIANHGKKLLEVYGSLIY